MSNIDWINIKNEYISTNISYRKLAEKYGVSRSNLEKRAKSEKWADLRKHQHGKIEEETQHQTADKIAETNADYIKELIEMSGLTISATKKAISQLESTYEDGEIKKTGYVNTYKLRQITQTMKDLKELVDNETEHLEDISDAEADAFGGKRMTEEEKQARQLAAITEAIKGRTVSAEKRDAFVKAIEPSLMGLIKASANGNVKAFEMLMELIGEKDFNNNNAVMQKLDSVISGIDAIAKE